MGKMNNEPQELCLYIDNTEQFYKHKITLFDVHSSKLFVAKNKVQEALIEQSRIAIFKSLCRAAAVHYSEKLMNIEKQTVLLFSVQTRAEAAAIINNEFMQYYCDKLIEKQTQ